MDRSQDLVQHFIGKMQKKVGHNILSGIFPRHSSLFFRRCLSNKKNLLNKSKLLPRVC